MKNRLQRVERKRALQMERAREGFRQFLGRLDHDQKRFFFERCLDAGLLPRWPHRDPPSPFSLSLDDSRVVCWIRQLENQVIAPGDRDAVDLTLHRLAKVFSAKVVATNSRQNGQPKISSSGARLQKKGIVATSGPAGITSSRDTFGCV